MRRGVLHLEIKVLALAVGVSSAAVSGCANDKARTESGEEVSLSSSVVDTLSTTGSGDHSATRPVLTWALDETLRIGASEGQGPEVFGRIDALQADAAGRIYVFDGFAKELRIFGPDGEHLGTFGGLGSGPGEFRNVVGIGLAPDGAIWLVDPENTRYTVLYGEDFRAYRMYRRPTPLYRLPWIGGFTTDGVFHDAAVLPGERGEVVLMVDSAGGLVGTSQIRVPELGPPRLGAMEFPLPNGPLVLRAFDEHGFFWTAQTHQYRLVKLSLKGDTVAVITRDAKPPALTATQRDSIRVYVRRLKAEFGMEVRSNMVPESGPILRSLFVDDAGNVWVRLMDSGEPPRLEIFDSSGRPIGKTVLPFSPAEDPIPIMRDLNLYAVVEGEEDVPVVVRAHIRRTFND